MELRTRDEIISRLSLKSSAIYKDRRDLLLWMKGEISDEELRDRMIDNNGIRADIPVSLVVSFAQSLNYYRLRRYDGEV